MKNFLLFLMTFSPMLLFAQVSWTGGAGTNDWNTDMNWDPVGVPGISDAVDIPSGNTVDFTGTSTVKRVKLNGSAQLNVLSGTLTIDGATAEEALEQTGSSATIINDGTIIIQNTVAQVGVLCKGTWTNNGTLTITNTNLHNLRVQGGNFTNNADGIINITLNALADQDGLSIDNNGGTLGNFTNDGMVNITMTAGDEGVDITDGSFLINNATFNISGGGADMGIKARNNGVLTNSGTMTITNTPDESILLESGGTVNNNNNGIIDISNTGSVGHAIDVNNGTFNNNAGALFKAITVKDGVYVRASGFVNNNGDMWLDDCEEEIEIAPGFATNFVNNASATFHPGSSPGDFEVKHDWNLGSSTTTFEINGLTAVTDYDQIKNFGGSGGGSTLTISASSSIVLDWGFTPVVGNCFKIIDGSGLVSGTFDLANVTSMNLSSSLDFEINYVDGDAAGAATEVQVCIIAPLPVDLVRFSGEKTERGSDLRWVTASELNNEGFEIERSNNGFDWTKIGYVRGNGTSNELMHYNYLDPAPSDGMNYYRLKQNDFDGRFEYSKTVSLDFKNEKSEITFFPNPVENVLYINSKQDLKNIEIQLFDSNGKMLWTNKGALSEISFEDYSPGLYFLNVVSPLNSTIQKIIKK